jgi:hypothetical protein
MKFSTQISGELKCDQQQNSGAGSVQISSHVTDLRQIATWNVHAARAEIGLRMREPIKVILKKALGGRK